MLSQSPANFFPRIKDVPAIRKSLQNMTVYNVHNMRTGDLLFYLRAWANFFPMTDESLRQDSLLFPCYILFDDGYVGKQPVAKKEYCVKCTGEKEVQENTNRCIGHGNFT